MNVIERLPEAARGALFMVLSTTCFAVLWALIRIATESLDPPLVVFYRTLFGLLFMAPILFRDRRFVFRTGRLPLHLLRAASGAVAMYATFYAVAIAPLADVVAISYATPLFVTVIAVLFLREIIRLRRISALFFGLIGMLLVLRPGLRELGIGHIWALLAAVMVACSLTAVKVLTASERTGTIVGFTYVFLLPVNFVVALFFWQVPTAQEFLLLAIIGILANLGQVFLTRAFALAEMSALLPLDFVRLLLASALGIILFQESLAWQTFLGAAIILVSTIYLAHREAQIARQPIPSSGSH